MAEEHFVIIGNGPAANEAAPILREKAPEARITIIGRELFRYYRPDFLPRFIAGQISEEELYVHPLEFYKDRDIKLRLGQAVVDVDFSKRNLALDHKEVIRFDGLIVATGARHLIPPSLEPYEDFMLTLKTMNDAKIWVEKLAEVESVLVIGCDLTSVVFAKALLALGKRVIFFLDRHSPHLGCAPENIHERIAEKLSELGGEVLDCPKIHKVEQISQTAVEVTTEDSQLTVGAVGAFMGMVPEVRFLGGSGLNIERGILVDEYLETNYKGVFAAGDCAQVYYPDIHNYWQSIGNRNAKTLGRTAALNLVGERVRTEVASSSIFHIDETPINTSWWLEC
jgi:NAD(P)H-nitrite reductase large subunit